MGCYIFYKISCICTYILFQNLLNALIYLQGLANRLHMPYLSIHFRSFHLIQIVDLFVLAN